jgi:hypothetical protein
VATGHCGLIHPRPGSNHPRALASASAAPFLSKEVISGLPSLTAFSREPKLDAPHDFRLPQRLVLARICSSMRASTSEAPLSMNE